MDRFGLRFAQFSENDWNLSNRLKYHDADGSCSKAERLINECKRTCSETFQNVTQKQEEVGRSFDHRIRDVDFWRHEVDNQVAGLQDAINKLLQYKDRLMTSLTVSGPPLSAAKQCLLFREKRQGVDNANDTPQQQLRKDVILIQDVQTVLQKAIDQVAEQIRVDRSVKHHLERDVADKYAALDLDTQANSRSPPTSAHPLHFQNELLTADPKSLSIGEWESVNLHNIRKSELERQKSKGLHPIMEEILSQTCADMQKQHENVLAALRDRIGQTQIAKERLEERLARVVEQIDETDDTIVQLQQAVDQKIPLLALSQNRLQTRRKRPRVELCRDSVELDLEKEVALITNVIQELRTRLKDAQEMLRTLLQNRVSLEEELQVKTNSIYIDEVECLGLLATIAIVRH